MLNTIYLDSLPKAIEARDRLQSEIKVFEKELEETKDVYKKVEVFLEGWKKNNNEERY